MLFAFSMNVNAAGDDPIVFSIDVNAPGGDSTLSELQNACLNKQVGYSCTTPNLQNQSGVCVDTLSGGYGLICTPKRGHVEF